MQAYESTLEIRAKRRELGGPADRQAPIFRQESEGGIRSKCGGSRAARADGAVVWVWNRRSKQLERMERDWVAPITALGTAGAAKWVNRHEYCLTQPRATISINIPTGPCVRPAAEAGERRLGAHPHWKSVAGEGGTRRASL